MRQTFLVTLLLALGVSFAAASPTTRPAAASGDPCMKTMGMMGMHSMMPMSSTTRPAMSMPMCKMGMGMGGMSGMGMGGMAMAGMKMDSGSSKMTMPMPPTTQPVAAPTTRP